MTHDEIEQGDVIDSYVRGDLTPAARDAFEEHYFGCDECFAKVREIETLRGAVHAGAEAGWLAANVPVPAPAPARRSRPVPMR